MSSIHMRMAKIVAEMPAIGKGQRNTQQNFMYRGHDDVMNALNPLLSTHEVFFTPNVRERITAQRTTRQGGIMYEVNLLVEYTFWGPEGDSITASAWGEGTDSGDKATNKAMTMALKNVLAQTFAVSTEESSRLDTDAHTDEETVQTYRDARQTEFPVPQTWAQVEEVVMRFGAGLWADFQALMRAAQAHEPGFSNSSRFRQAAAGVAVSLAEGFSPDEVPFPTVDDLQRLWAPAVAGAVLTPVYPEPEQPVTPEPAASEEAAEVSDDVIPD